MTIGGFNGSNPYGGYNDFRSKTQSDYDNFKNQVNNDYNQYSGQDTDKTKETGSKDEQQPQDGKTDISSYADAMEKAWAQGGVTEGGVLEDDKTEFDVNSMSPDSIIANVIDNDAIPENVKADAVKEALERMGYEIPEGSFWSAQDLVDAYNSIMNNDLIEDKAGAFNETLNRVLVKTSEYDSQSDSWGHLDAGGYIDETVDAAGRAEDERIKRMSTPDTEDHDAR